MSNEDETSSPLEVAKIDIYEYCGKILKEFEVLSPPVLTVVSGSEAVDYEASFLFEHVKLPNPVRVRMKTLTIFQGEIGYTFRMYDSPYVGQDNVFDYSDFVNTISIV